MFISNLGKIILPVVFILVQYSVYRREGGKKKKEKKSSYFYSVFHISSIFIDLTDFKVYGGCDCTVFSGLLQGQILKALRELFQWLIKFM